MIRKETFSPSNLTHSGVSRRQFLVTSATVAAAAGASWAAGSDDKPLVTQFGVCTSHKHYQDLNKAGYSYIEENTRRLLKPSQPNQPRIDQSLAALKKSGVKILACNSFLPGSLKSVGKDANHEAILKYAETAFARLKLLGGKGIVFGSSASRNIPQGFDRDTAEQQFVSLLKKMAPLAKKQGVEVWLEPLNRKETNFIHTQIDGARIIEKVGHPSLGMVCDIYHCARNEEKPESLHRLGKSIRHCHIAEKQGRTAPGTNGYDFTPWFTALRKSGFSGTMSVEGRWKSIQEQALPVRKYMEDQIAKSA